DARAVAEVAGQYGLEHRMADLADPTALDAALDGMRVVLHCAGPFMHTSRPMVDACLRRGVHYLDITGEMAVFEALAARDAEADARGVTLLPGVGFDVVPSDCLAAHLAQRLPGATELVLAFQGLGGVSRGTATTMAENAGTGGAVRRDGQIIEVPAAWRSRDIEFVGGAPALAVTIPWGDVATAWHSTGIPNIAVYMAMTPAMRRALVASRWLGPLLRLPLVPRRLVAKARARKPGPSDAARMRGVSRFWGEVRDARGNRAVSRLTAPEGYTLTARTAVAAAQRVLAGGVATGFQTPSQAFGADFILEQRDTRREDVE
nr:saccharopine dehydrogenase NADP-binding domain-containing protein [Gemmatimonadaceae bacterium]